MVGVLAVGAGAAMRGPGGALGVVRAPSVLRHKVGGEVDVRHLAVGVEMYVRPFERVEGVGSAVLIVHGVPIRLVPPSQCKLVSS